MKIHPLLLPFLWFACPVASLAIDVSDKAVYKNMVLPTNSEAAQTIAAKAGVDGLKSCYTSIYPKGNKSVLSQLNLNLRGQEAQVECFNLIVALSASKSAASDGEISKTDSSHSSDGNMPDIAAGARLPKNVQEMNELMKIAGTQGDLGCAKWIYPTRSDMWKVDKHLKDIRGAEARGNCASAVFAIAEQGKDSTALALANDAMSKAEPGMH